MDGGFAQAISMNGGSLRITEMPGHAASEHPVFGWSVADIRATCRVLSKRGVRFEIYEGMEQDADGIWTAPDGKTMVAFFKDPDGNVFRLTKS